jgi:hypothetical protein
MSSLYDKGAEGLLDGSINWVSDDIRMILIDTGAYTVDLAAHDFLNDIPSGARTAVSGSLASRTATGGVADAADIVLSSVSGPESEAIVLYKHTGTESTSRLLAYIDDAGNLPITPGGGDITFAWDNGPNKIFKL